MPLKVEIEDTAKGFRFRLVSHTNTSPWCGYKGIAYLEGKVTATEYYLPAEYDLKPIDPDKFCQLIADK